MKYLLMLFVTFMSHVAMARQTITIVYPFPNESITNIYRLLAAEANRSQDRYSFIVDVRPGAGGAIATNHVSNTPHTILAHTTAFFVRPNVYPRESYDLKNFRSLYVMCQVPMAVSSSRYQTWKEVPRSTPLTIGTSGLGVTSHLISMALAQNLPNLDVVPFKSTGEALLGLVSGSIDLQVGFISEAEQWRDTSGTSSRRVQILGITGSQAVNNYPTLTSQGFARDLANMTLAVHLVVPAVTTDVVAREFYDIFDKASRAPAVRAAFAQDNCIAQSVGFDALPKFYQSQTDLWRRMSEKIRIN